MKWAPRAAMNGCASPDFSERRPIFGARSSAGATLVTWADGADRPGNGDLPVGRSPPAKSGKSCWPLPYR